jgi:hypothetical protein
MSPTPYHGGDVAVPLFQQELVAHDYSLVVGVEDHGQGEEEAVRELDVVDLHAKNKRQTPKSEKKKTDAKQSVKE